MEMDSYFLAYLDASVCITLAGIICNMLVLAIFYKRRDLRTPWNIVNIPLNISEIAFGCMNFVGSIDIRFSPLEAASTRCTLQGMTILLCGAFSSFSLVLIAFERFRAICYSRPIQTREWILITALAFAGALVLALLPLFDPHGYVISGSGNYCVACWYGTTWNLRLASILSLLALAVTGGSINYFYLCIFKRYKEILRQTNRAKVSTSVTEEAAVPPGKTWLPESTPDTIEASKKSVKKTSEQKDKIILIKSCCYIVSYVCLWLPYVSLILAEMIMQHSASSTWHILASIFAESSSLVNPLQLILLSPAFKAEIKSWFITTGMH